MRNDAHRRQPLRVDIRELQRRVVLLPGRGLRLQYAQRVKHGLTLQAGWTWSKNIDTGSEATSVGTGDINAVVSEKQGARSLRGPSRLSQPQRFSVSYVYELPFFKGQKGVLGTMAGGWQISGADDFRLR